MLRFRSALALGVLALSACGDYGWIEIRLTKPQRTSVDIGSYLSETYVDPEIRSATMVPKTAPRRKPKGYVVDRAMGVDPDVLVGLDMTSTKVLLGDPALQFEKAPAKVWSYHGGICTLNIFFFPEVEDDHFRLLAYRVINETSINETSPVDTATQTPQSPETGVTAEQANTETARRCLAKLLSNSNQALAIKHRSKFPPAL